LACDVATLAPPPTLSTNPNSEMLPLVVAPVEKLMLWAWVGSLTLWLWVGSLTPWAWVGSLTPWPWAGICATSSATVCVPPAAPSTAPSMPEAPAVMRLPAAPPLSSLPARRKPRRAGVVDGVGPAPGPGGAPVGVDQMGEGEEEVAR